MMPVGPLMIEHRLIERMIALLDQHVKAATSPQTIDLSLIEKGVDFLRTYADRCHCPCLSIAFTPDVHLFSFFD